MARTRSENYDGIYLGILTNAAALFSAQGYMRSSIADLADACKLSRGALYHYFDSKEAILFAILDAHVREMIQHVEAAIALGGQTLVQFRNVIRAIVEVNAKIGEFLGTDAALGIIPCIGEVDDSEQDHRIDLLGALDDLALRVEPDQQIGNDIDQLPFQILDGLLLVLVKKRQIVNQHPLLIRRLGVDLDDGANDIAKLHQGLSAQSD